MSAEPPLCPSNLPLRKFLPGQRLCFKFLLSNQYGVTVTAEFIAIKRGLVLLRVLPGWEPDWYRTMDMERRYPGMVARVRPTSCYLWAKRGPEYGGVPGCHWFKDLDTPVM